jgi:hypothetical protein
MNKADEVIMDGLLEQSLRLERFSASEKAKVLKILDDLQGELRLKLLDSLTDFGKSRVNKLLSESTAIIEAAYKEIAPAKVEKVEKDMFGNVIIPHKRIELEGRYDKVQWVDFDTGEKSIIYDTRGLADQMKRQGKIEWIDETPLTKSTDLLGLARHEATATASTFATIGLEAAIPTEAVLRALVNDTLLQGAPLSAWWAKQSDDLAFRYANAVRQGVAQGETLQQMIVRVFGSKRLGTPGIGFPDSVLRRNASALVHDSIMSVTGAARMAVYQENQDIMKGYRWLSTLDSIICKVCVARSGAKWDLNFKPMGSPAFPFVRQGDLHSNCRCAVLPILKSYKELGADIQEPPTGTRASDLGQVPADLSFDGFLKRHTKNYQDDLLGPGRAELWRAGKISLSDLVSQNGRPLTLEQLRGKK